MGIKDRQIALIERTKNPLAPIIMQNVADATEQFGGMLGSVTTQEKVDEVVARLLKDFPNDHDPIFASPEFCMALSAMLKNSSILFVRNS
jgi:hypothetical protein